ncbi:DUF262 domain-containing protein [Hymenobacter sp. ASUV-10]|uniref:DUF262 domain-containing protein n=1 Tax=Hymenobacter aranciens TaxID=3063996 RepID=A0ABT9B8Z5_9BACT|nr:DUF262 domain-containing protein [Hymenobacter sp. ASUV-10]MDO7874744.1 DUF262 domain-containing protein [Hymenobacter sp. ASUV-10]
MQTNYYTFWTLLNTPEIKYIQVPIIQRDYAQGRKSEKVNSIRIRLVDALHNALSRQEPLTLDFVYGELRGNLFIPLDGQQRLTTLFLLHWYLALVDGELSNVQALLSKFTYETRSSSREFCRQLVMAKGLDLNKYPTLTDAILDTNWFQPSWERDPTVGAMLTMLDALQTRFANTNGLFAHLADADNPLIGFYFLDMPKVGLTDDLYLKMNARGKPLTSFENWKAEFDLFLQRKHSKKVQSDFGDKIDGPWLDFFWKHRQPGSEVADEAMEQFLHYLTRMLAYRMGEKVQDVTLSRLGFDLFERVFAQDENVDFLFQSLDFLVKVEKQEPNGIAGLLERLLTEKTESERVRVFGGTRPDIFNRCLRNTSPNQELQEQVLLFGLLVYGATVSDENFTEGDVQNQLRVLRNLLEQIRQQNDKELNSNLRADNMQALTVAATILGKSESGSSPDVYKRLEADAPLLQLGRRGVEHERLKAHLLTAQPELAQAIHELENQYVLRGDLRNLKMDEHINHIESFRQAVSEIWSGAVPQDLIIRAWLTCGDYRVSQGEWKKTQLGRKYFLGNSENWYTVLAADIRKGEPNLLSAFLITYHNAIGNTAVQKLESIIADWLAVERKRDWRYYFIKYPGMTEKSEGYYAWGSDFYVRLLEGNSLKAKHINPYVRTISRRRQVADAIADYGEQFVNDTWASPLYLDNIPGWPSDNWDLSLHSGAAGWRLNLPTGYTLPTILEELYELQPVANGQRWLVETAEQDRIERVEDFIKALRKQGLEAIESEDGTTDSTST